MFFIIICNFNQHTVALIHLFKWFVISKPPTAHKYHFKKNYTLRKGFDEAYKQQKTTVSTYHYHYTLGFS